MLTPGQVISHPDGVNGTEIPVGSTVAYRMGEQYEVRLQKRLVCGGANLKGDAGPMTILTLPPGYGEAAGFVSQCNMVGTRSRTWDDYEQGCLATYSGGHRGEMAEAFKHGMSTVFNLLRAEFPPANVCKTATPTPDAGDELAEAAMSLRTRIATQMEWDRSMNSDRMQLWKDVDGFLTRYLTRKPGGGA